MILPCLIVATAEGTGGDRAVSYLDEAILDTE